MKRFGYPGLAVTLALAACGQAVPGGQVIATVGGVEITRREVAIELEAAPAPPGTPFAAAEKAALDRLIERKLLIAAARDLLIDRSPEFVAAIRRDRETRLAALLSARLQAQVPPPDAGAVARFIAANPQWFAGRQQVVVDRISVAAGGVDPVSLADAIGNDAVAAMLGERRTAFRRELAIVDTIDLTPDQAQALGVGIAVPLVTRAADGTIQSSVAVTSKPMPLNPAANEALARRALIGLAAEAAFRRYVDRLREQTAIAIARRATAPG